MRCTEHDPLWYECDGFPCVNCPEFCHTCRTHIELCKCEPYDDEGEERTDEEMV